MMTEAQFLDRFQRQPNGEWACTKPIKVVRSAPFSCEAGLRRPTSALTSALSFGRCRGSQLSFCFWG